MPTERWRHGIASRGAAFDEFWKVYLRDPSVSVLYVLGVGFDPRMCEGLRRIRALSPSTRMHCLGLKMDYGDSGGDLADAAAKNLAALESLVDSSHLKFETVPVTSVTHPGQSSAVARQVVQKHVRALGATHVVVDLSSTPESIGLSALVAVLQEADAERGARVINTHVVISHNPRLDESIEHLDVQRDPFPINGLLQGFDEESTHRPKTIWMPVLGRNRLAEMQAIRNEWHATEVCPIVPSPSEDPRLADDLIVEYRDIIQGGAARSVPRNILRVAEHDPFEAYSQIAGTLHEYGRSYDLVGGCRVLLTVHASKLLSVAALMAAYDPREGSLCRGTTVAVVESWAYRMKQVDVGEGELFTMWLTGTPYS